MKTNKNLSSLLKKTVWVLAFALLFNITPYVINAGEEGIFGYTSTAKSDVESEYEGNLFLPQDAPGTDNLHLDEVATEIWIKATVTDEVIYLDDKGMAQTANSVTKVMDDTATTLNNGWYLFSGEWSSGQITANGDVHIILADDCNVMATQGIFVTEASSLTIYAQSDAIYMGILTAYGDTITAGIGGSQQEKAQAITIRTCSHRRFISV